jgi:hypothetical protein
MTDRDNDWRATMQHGLDMVAEQGRDGTAFELWVIPCYELETIKAQAKAGDDDAYVAVSSIIDWLAMIDTANREDNVLPNCTCCEKEMPRGKVAGWAIFIPKEEHKTGMVGAFCAVCYEHGPDQIMRDAVTNMMKEMGAKPMALH